MTLLEKICAQLNSADLSYALVGGYAAAFYGANRPAAIKLVRQLGGVVVESCFVIDLPDLGGSKKVQEEMDCPCYSICEFEGD